MQQEECELNSRQQAPRKKKRPNQWTKRSDEQAPPTETEERLEEAGEG